MTAVDQFSSAAPVLLIATVWVNGLLPPCTPVNDSEFWSKPDDWRELSRQRDSRWQTH